MLLRALSLFILTFLLNACSTFEFPWVYKISVQQGNILDLKDIDKLELGMTKRQVQFVMGTPLLTDPFNTDRWDYYYSRRDGKGEIKEERFTAFFENDIYVKHEGSIKPTAEQSKDEKRTTIPDEDTQEVIDNPEKTIEENSVY
ncbi:MAG: outer membrane protein assembly factor BamE [Marinagarivorans sp.]|nr:outer membrane protein assembly factor BamE [Marinagarivorans sp.]